MQFNRCLEVVLIFIILTSVGFANGGQDYIHLGELNLENGDVIKECKIGYRTFGKVNQDSSNVILYPTWFGGTSEHIKNLIENGDIVDSTKYLIIAVDALGNGVSSSPSNSNLQPASQFPKFSIHDMVKTQYQLLNKLGFDHIFGIVGGSMGSFQAFEWLVTYSTFIEKAVPYVCTPKLTAPDKLWMKFQLEIVELGLENNCSEAQIQKILDIYSNMSGRTPQYFLENMPEDQFDQFYKKFSPRTDDRFTLENRASQIKAMLTHDITRNFNGSLKQAVDEIQAEIFMIVSETDHLVNPALSQKLVKISDAEIMVLENNCGHLGVGCALDTCTQAISDFLDQ
ncbi:MAG: alpha/beta fold hydrolase [Candidatus Marinimicrobia bacterium]|nr:alpha/beta fold hydrolase [Candidatus Neomarinimicrobiota bacterium]